MSSITKLPSLMASLEELTSEDLRSLLNRAQTVLIRRTSDEDTASSSEERSKDSPRTKKKKKGKKSSKKSLEENMDQTAAAEKTTATPVGRSTPKASTSTDQATTKEVVSKPVKVQPTPPKVLYSAVISARHSLPQLCSRQQSVPVASQPRGTPPPLPGFSSRQGP